MARAIAICKGGPLDGQLVSVEVGEDGSPQPLTGRAEVLGVLYMPGAAAKLTKEHRDQFRTYGGIVAANGTVKAAVVGGMEHEAAFVYLPHECTLERDADGLVTAVVPGAAI